jgi:hypothetical protein
VPTDAVTCKKRVQTAEPDASSMPLVEMSQGHIERVRLSSGHLAARQFAVDTSWRFWRAGLSRASPDRRTSLAVSSKMQLSSIWSWMDQSAIP